ncbi:MAG: hypothetical protein ACK4PG_13855 [Acetobacteraceae bacterium]
MGETTMHAPLAAAPRAPARRRYLFGPWLDALCLGGASLLLLPVALATPAEWVAPVAVTMMLLANLINHPHFAHSYQIMYRGFGARLADPALPPELRRDAWIAGVLVPAALLLLLGGAIAAGEIRALGIAGNLMGFLVGWHYVKQGYGILMLDAALKRRFFTEGEKRVLLLNAHVVWLASWLAVNTALAQREMWGVQFLVLGLPEWVTWLGIAAASATGLLTLAMLVRRAAPPPWVGLLAYAVSIYAWLAFVAIHPVWLLIVPALHSLQYLAVVYRFEWNRAGSAPDAALPHHLPLIRLLLPMRREARMAGFIVAGIAIGAVMFWGAPLVIGAMVAAPETMRHALPVLFAAWVFVNVHHYFIDSVIWRSDNPDARRHLFA